MVDKGLYVPVSCPLHGILQVNVGIVCDLGQCGTSCTMVALLGNAQHLAVTLVVAVNGVGSDAVIVMQEDIAVRLAIISHTLVTGSYLLK